jgi:DNA-binding beta-propeller fold protein YncE
MLSARPTVSGLDRAAWRLGMAVLCVLACTLELDAGVARAEREFGSYGTKGGQFVEPNGIAVDQESGDVYVMDSGNERVEKFTSDGAFLLAWGWGVADGHTPALQTCTRAAHCFGGLDGTGAGQFGFAEGLAVDNDPHSASHHDVYVVDIDSYRVEKFSPAGRFLLMFGGAVNASARERGEVSGEGVCPVLPGDRCTIGTSGSASGQFDFRDEGNFIAVGTGGMIYVGDHNRVQEFSPNGTYKSQVALVPAVRGGGEEGGTLALALDADGGMYVVRYGISGVQRYTPGGQLVQTLDEEAVPEGDESPTPSMTVDPEGHLFLDYHVGQEHHVVEYDALGLEVASFDTGMAYGPGGLDGLHGIAYGDAAGSLYVVNAESPFARVRILAVPGLSGGLFSGFQLASWLFG